jgi:predicted Zn-dependent peptidase
VAYAFPGLSNADADYFVAQIYATALGGGTSSRLFQEAREKRGLCYSIYAFSNGFQDSGFLGVYVGTGETEAAGISAVIAGEMEAMSVNLTEAEVARARAQLKVSLLMGLERPSNRSEQIAGQLFALGRVQSAAEIVAQLDAIDAAAVKAFAARVMEAGHPTIAAVGPVKKLESITAFAGRFGGKAIPDAAE